MQVFDASGATLDSLACPSATFCLALVGRGTDSIDVLTYAEGHWSTAVGVAKVSGSMALSCASTVFCVAAGHDQHILMYDDGAWSSTAVGSSNVLSLSVACATPSWCEGIEEDRSGNDSAFFALSYDGRTWHRGEALVRLGPIRAVECPSLGACVAVDGDGEASVFHNSAWIGPVPVTAAGPGGPTPLTALSCAGATFCAAGDSTGAVYLYNGAEWTLSSRLPTHP